MDVKPGYKQTEVGVIPEDWEVKNLGNVVTLQRGYDLPSRLRRPGSFPIVTSSGIEDFHCEAKVKGPGVVTGRYGTIGEVFWVPGDFWPLNTTLYVRNFFFNIPLFAFYLIRTIDFKPHSGKSGVPGVNRNDLHEILVPLPPTKAEQEAIAAALSDVDALIAALDRLIAKKRDIKQAAMQELLTGKKRLPGFGDDEICTEAKKTPPNSWRGLSIYDLVENIIDYRGRTPRKLGMVWGEGEIPALSANNVKMGYIDFREETYFGSEALYKRWMTNGRSKKDDIVVTMEAPLGNIAQIPNDKKYILSQRTILLQINNADACNRFIFYFMTFQSFQKVLAENATGTTAKGIQRKKFEKLEIVLPPVPEQQAIAAILSDMDAEITALEARREKTRALKQGMMQGLLTGRIRLV